MCPQTATDGEARDAAGEAAVVITVSTWTPADALLPMKYIPLLSSFVSTRDPEEAPRLHKRGRFRSASGSARGL